MKNSSDRFHNITISYIKERPIERQKEKRKYAVEKIRDYIASIFSCRMKREGMSVRVSRFTSGTFAVNIIRLSFLQKLAEL